MKRNKLKDNEPKEWVIRELNWTICLVESADS